MAGLITSATTTSAPNAQGIVNTVTNKKIYDPPRTIVPTQAPVTPGAPVGGGMSADAAKAALATSKDYYAKQATASLAGYSGYNATDWDVKGDQLVEHRVAGLTDPNSMLNTQAAARAKAESAKRGLINSSMAVTAGQDAILKTALPIASQDAGTFASSAATNAKAKNDAAAFTANAGNQAELTNAQLKTNTALANTAAENDAAAANARGATDVSKTNAAHAVQTQLAQLQANTSLTLADKNNATAVVLQNIQSSTQLSVADKNNLTARTIQAMQGSTQEKIAALNSSTQLSVADKQILSNQIIAAADVASREKVAQLSSDTQTFLGNLNAATSLATNKLSNETQLGISQMDNTNKKELQTIISNNSQLLQANTSAANLAAQYLNNVAQVQMSTTMDGPAKQAAVDNLLNIMNQGFAAIGGITGLDLSQYFRAANNGVVPTPSVIPPAIGVPGEGNGGSGPGTSGDFGYLLQ